MRLGLITYGTVTLEQGKLYLNEKIGMLADELAEYFEKVFLVASEAPYGHPMFYREDGQSIYRYSFQHNNIECITIPFYAYDSLWVKLRKIFKAVISVHWKVIRESDFLYIFMPNFTNYLTVLLCRFLGKPYALYFGADWYEVIEFNTRWEATSRFLLYLYRALVGLFERYAVRGTLFSIVHGQRTLERLRKIGTPVFEAIPMLSLDESDVYVREDTCQGEEISCLFVGAVIPRKGLEYAIEALSLLRQDGYPVCLYIVGTGDPDYQDYLKERIRTLRLESYCRFLGYVGNKEKLLTLYRSSDLFILPTLGEGFPRVLYEALSQSLPVVVSRIESIERTLGSDAPVIYAEPRNPWSIANGIRLLLQHHELRRCLIRKGREWVAQRLRGSHAQQFLQIFNIIAIDRNEYYSKAN